MIKDIECWLAVCDYDMDRLISSRQHPSSTNYILVVFSCPKCNSIWDLPFIAPNTAVGESNVWSPNLEKTHLVNHHVVWCHNLSSKLDNDGDNTCTAGMILTLPFRTYKADYGANVRT
jgi:hypothetical protein